MCDQPKRSKHKICLPSTIWLNINRTKSACKFKIGQIIQKDKCKFKDKGIKNFCFSL
jgi:hypothetical protein